MRGGGGGGVRGSMATVNDTLELLLVPSGHHTAQTCNIHNKPYPLWSFLCNAAVRLSCTRSHYEKHIKIGLLLPLCEVVI